MKTKGKEGKKERKQITGFDGVNIWAVKSTRTCIRGSNDVTDRTVYSQRDLP